MSGFKLFLSRPLRHGTCHLVEVPLFSLPIFSGFRKPLQNVLEIEDVKHSASIPVPGSQ